MAYGQSENWKEMLARSMMPQNVGGPIASPWQGVAQMLQAGLSAYGMKQAQDERTESRKGSLDALAAAMAGGGGLTMETLRSLPDQDLAMALMPQALQGEDDNLMQVYDNGAMRWVPESQAAGMQASAPPDWQNPDFREYEQWRANLNQTPREDPLQQVWDPEQNAMVLVPRSQAAGRMAAAPEQAPPGYEWAEGPDGSMVIRPVDPTSLVQQPAQAPQAAPQGPSTPEGMGLRLGGQPSPQAAPGAAQMPPGVQTVMPAPPDQEATQDAFANANVLRDDFNSSPAVKNYGEALNGLRKVEAAATMDSAPGDIALIFGFMKTIDPTSTVREGEFATAQNAGGVGDRIINLYNSLLTGERLNPRQREDFAATARNQFQTYQDAYDAAVRSATEQAQRAGVNPADIIVGYGQQSQGGGAAHGPIPPGFSVVE